MPDWPVGLVAERSQVVSDNWFDPQQDHKMVLADVQRWDQEDIDTEVDYCEIMNPISFYKHS